ncbi:hypothetical protein V8C86DRAFT_2442795 [Haematococcus lacustris]
MEPSWDGKEPGGRGGPGPGGAEQKRGLLTPRATTGQREAQGQQDGTRGAELGVGQANKRKPTLLGLTKLTLGMGFEVDLLHLVVGDSLEQKVVVVSQLVAIFQLASTTVNKVLLNLQARGFWYKVFTGPPLVKQLVQANIVPASTSKPRPSLLLSSSSKHGLPPPASLLPNPTLRAVRWVAPELPITLPSMAGGCKGNRFEYDGATAAWRLVVPHSKNSSKGVPGIVLPLTDTKEVKLLEAYECQARPVLLGQIGTHEHLVEAMYLNNKGQPYTIESLATWWRRTYKSNQAPWPFVPFHELRNVFITDRLDNPDMPGPSIQGYHALV